TATRRELGDYIDGLHAAHEPWGVSAYDALQELARLTAERPGPRTRVRLGEQALRRLTGAELEEARDLLVRASALGPLTLRPHDTPGYGARGRRTRRVGQARPVPRGVVRTEGERTEGGGTYEQVPRLTDATSASAALER